MHGILASFIMLNRFRIISSDIYFWTLAIMAVSLPFFPKILVVCQIILILNWILEGNIVLKLKQIRKRKSILVFLAIYAAHILWLLNTSDFKQAFTDLEMKLPLLILPIVIGTSKPIEYYRIRQIIKFFILAVFVSTVISALWIFNIIPSNISDERNTLFISSVRFSLFVVVCILCVLNWIIKGKKTIYQQLDYILLCIWLVFFLVLLKSLTGIIILFVTASLLIILFNKRIDNPFLKVGLAIFIFALPIFTISYIGNSIDSYFEKDTLDSKNLKTVTINGKPYTHDTKQWQTENGHYVWINICAPELKKEWNKRSKISFDSLDIKNQPLNNTLIRYLTSKGLSKDSVGIWKLKPSDINNVETGMTNYIFENKWSLFPRIYEVIWEVEQYQRNKDVNGHSTTMRLVYMDISWQFFKHNIWFGIAPGDIRDEYLKYYKTHETGIEPKRYHETHNQFLRFLTVFGILGFLIVMLGFILPPVFEKKWSVFYFVAAFIVIFLSFINEDTIETQIGVTFVAYFYSLFLWGTESNEELQTYGNSPQR